jgi:hypothetical protein
VLLRPPPLELVGHALVFSATILLPLSKAPPFLQPMNFLQFGGEGGHSVVVDGEGRTPADGRDDFAYAIGLRLVANGADVGNRVLELCQSGTEHGSLGNLPFLALDDAL